MGRVRGPCDRSRTRFKPSNPASAVNINKLLLIVSCVALSAACESSPNKPAAQPAQPVAPVAAGVVAPDLKPAEPAAQAPTHRYSPFVLRVEQGSVFKKISFKDVGFKLREDEAEARAVYEVIAESLAQELSGEVKLQLAAEVAYDEAILDPNNHVACGSDHLYVDVWRSKQPERWGYSLWSGCGEDDNFAWREIKVEGQVAGDPIEEVRPLTRGIVEALSTAVERGCYQKTC